MQTLPAESFPTFTAALTSVSSQEAKLVAARAVRQVAANAYFDAPLSDGSAAQSAAIGALRDAYRAADAIVTYELEMLVGAQRFALAAASGELGAVAMMRELNRVAA